MEKKSLLKRLKEWFERKVNKTKALGEGSNKEATVVKKENRLDFCKTKLISELTNEEINLVLASLKDINTQEIYDKKQLTTEVLLRIGAEEELAKRIVENDRAYDILQYHIGCGKLVSTADGRVIFEDIYTRQDVNADYPIEERTVISFEDESIKINNTEDYDYYSDLLDSNKVRSVKLTANDRNGVTLQNKEILESGEHLTSTIVFDEHNIEVEKRRPMIEQMYGKVVILVMKRCEDDPYSYEEAIIEDGNKESIGGGIVNYNRPDQLYSMYINAQNNFGMEQGRATKREFNLKYLRQKNPKAAQYFHSIENGKEEKVGEEV